GVMLYLGEEEGEGKRILITRAKRVAKTRLVEGCSAVAEVNRRVVNENLKAGGGYSTTIVVLRAGNAKTNLEIIKQCVDCVFVSADDLFGVFIEIGANTCFPVFEGLFSHDCGFEGGARGAGVRQVARFDGLEVAQRCFD